MAKKTNTRTRNTHKVNPVVAEAPVAEAPVAEAPVAEAQQLPRNWQGLDGKPLHGVTETPEAFWRSAVMADNGSLTYPQILARQQFATVAHYFLHLAEKQQRSAAQYMLLWADATASPELYAATSKRTAKLAAAQAEIDTLAKRAEAQTQLLVQTLMATGQTEEQARAIVAAL